MTTRGIDCSSFQGAIDWKQVKEAGAEFAIVKVTEGNGYRNPYAQAQMHGAESNGLEVYCYHFARPNGPNWEDDARAESELAAALAGDRFLFLDVERNEPLSLGERSLWRHWCNTFRRAYPRAIGWYSYRPFTQQLDLEQDWEDTILWLARYPIPFRADGQYTSWPDGVGPWARVDIWQDGGGGPGGNNSTWPGVTGPCDCDLFAGSLAELKELISSAK